MFFGTPHTGAKGAEFQAFLNNIGRIFVPGNSQILNLLNRDSDHLRFLTELYAPIARDFKTIFFYEEFKTPLFNGVSIMVRCFGCCMYYSSHSQYMQIVPKDSAVVLGVAGSDAIALHKHHIDLVKFSSKDQDFETVVNHIGIMMEGAIPKIDDNWKHEITMKSEYLLKTSWQKLYIFDI